MRNPEFQTARPLTRSPLITAIIKQRSPLSGYCLADAYWIYGITNLRFYLSRRNRRLDIFSTAANLLRTGAHYQALIVTSSYLFVASILLISTDWRNHHYLSRLIAINRVVLQESDGVLMALCLPSRRRHLVRCHRLIPVPPFKGTICLFHFSDMTLHHGGASGSN